jgi:hypothetical protein
MLREVPTPIPMSRELKGESGQYLSVGMVVELLQDWNNKKGEVAPAGSRYLVAQNVVWYRTAVKCFSHETGYWWFPKSYVKRHHKLYDE